MASMVILVAKVILTAMVILIATAILKLMTMGILIAMVIHCSGIVCWVRTNHPSSC